MKKLIALMVMAVMVLGILTCTAQASDGVTLTIMHDKTGAPDYHPYFVQAGEELNAATGISLNPVGYPSTDVYTAAIRSALPGAGAPDLFTWWAAAWTQDLQKNDLLLPLTSIWDKHKDEFSQGVRDAYTIDGELYSLPWAADYWLAYYNKDVYAELGLDVPDSWEKFIANCEAIKNAGKTPLNQTIVDEWPAFITFEEIAASYGTGLYNDLCTGKKSWKDPEAVQIFVTWKEMIDKGYFTAPSVNYFSDVPRMFNDDQLVMILGGTWFFKSNLLDNGVPESKIGAFFIKGMDGKNRAIMEPSPILVSKNGRNIENTLKAIDYFMSAEGNTFLAKQTESLPVNGKSDASYLPPFKLAIQNEILGDYALVTRFWENMPTELMLQVNAKFQEFILSPDPESITADIQALCDAYFN